MNIKIKKKITPFILCVAVILIFYPTEISLSQGTTSSDNINKNDVVGFSIAKGDVLIAKSLLPTGILWHSAIAISKNKILHINRWTGGTKTISWKKWNKVYLNKNNTWFKVYRHEEPQVAADATNWVKKTYLNNESVSFVINGDLKSTEYTYCSKLVWQAYYFGPKEPSVEGTAFGFRFPYDLHKTIKGLRLKYICRKKSNGEIVEVFK